MPLNAPALLEALERYRVQYVVVGGYAAELHGSLRQTVDVDVVPSTTVDNLDRLAAALREIQAKIRTDGLPEGLPFSPSGEAMVGMTMLNLVTAHGELDVNFTPLGHHRLRRPAHRRQPLRHRPGPDPGRFTDRRHSEQDRCRASQGLRRSPELYKLAGGTGTGTAMQPTPRSAPKLARAGYPDRITPVTAQDLAQDRIEVARQQGRRSRADTAKRKPPPAQR